MSKVKGRKVMSDFNIEEFVRKLKDNMEDEKATINFLNKEGIDYPVPTARLIQRGVNPGEESPITPDAWPKLLEMLNEEFSDIYHREHTKIDSYRSIKILLTDYVIEFSTGPIEYRIKVSPEKFIFTEAGISLGVPIVPSNVESVKVSYEIVKKHTNQA